MNGAIVNMIDSNAYKTRFLTKEIMRQVELIALNPVPGRGDGALLTGKIGGGGE